MPTSWQEIREQYPYQWVIFEAIGAYTDGPRRVIENIVFVSAHGSDGGAAMKICSQLHRDNRCHEYYFYHTGNDEIKIGILDPFWRVVE